MAFLKDCCARYPPTPEIVAACVPFSCGDKDLDEFFSPGYADYQRQLMGKTYVLSRNGRADGKHLRVHSFKRQYLHLARRLVAKLTKG